jgi:hypothetical protein
MSDPVLDPDPDPDRSADRIAGAAERIREDERSARSTGAFPDPSRRALVLSALLSGVLAAVISWGVGESKGFDARAKRGRFRTVLGPVEGMEPAAKLAAERVTSTRLHAIFGGLLGLFLGVAGGVARRSIGSALVAGLVGAGLGASLGGGAAYLVVPAYARYRQINGGDLMGSLLMHGVLWAGIGAAGGLAMGLGLGGRLRPLRMAGAGILGAILGILVFEFLGALAFPLDETGSPAATTARARLLARLLVAVPSAVVAAMAASRTPAGAPTTERT